MWCCLLSLGIYHIPQTWQCHFDMRNDKKRPALHLANLVRRERVWNVKTLIPWNYTVVFENTEDKQNGKKIFSTVIVHCWRQIFEKYSIFSNHQQNLQKLFKPQLLLRWILVEVSLAFRSPTHFPIILGIQMNKRKTTK